MSFEANHDTNAFNIKAKRRTIRTDVFTEILRTANLTSTQSVPHSNFLDYLSADSGEYEPDLGSIVKHKITEEVGFVCGETTLICGQRALKFRTFDSAPTESVACIPADLTVVGDPELRVGYSVNTKTSDS